MTGTDVFGYLVCFIIIKYYSNTQIKVCYIRFIFEGLYTAELIFIGAYFFCAIFFMNKIYVYVICDSYRLNN